jgi:hypothetical protein
VISSLRACKDYALLVVLELVDEKKEKGKRSNHHFHVSPTILVLHDCVATEGPWPIIVNKRRIFI